MACPTAVDSPPELRRFARRVLARARRDGLLRHGNAWGVPRTGTEQWPFAAAGVPSLGLADQVEEYMRIAYHTQHDRIELVDPACFTDAVRLYARFVIAADRNPGALLDLAARPRDIRRHGRIPALARGGVDTRHLQASLDRYESAAGRRVPYEAARRAFSMTASAVEGLNARDKQDLSHRQAATDVVELTAAVRSLARGRRRSAISALERVGRNALTARLSEPVFAHDAARHQPDHPGITWAGPHLTPSPESLDRARQSARGGGCPRPRCLDRRVARGGAAPRPGRCPDARGSRCGELRLRRRSARSFRDVDGRRVLQRETVESAEVSR